MEAVPKLPMISFELKQSTENTHFGPKLKQYIAEAYREDPDSYSNEIHQLEGLRSTAVRPTIDSVGLKNMIRYFCQLRSMQSRFPMAKGQPAACSFAWRDLYANMSCSVADIRFEMACILYNIGALLAQLAASEPRTSADSLKAACTHYQNAAWAFQYLREQYPQLPGVDVSTDIMRLLQEICFAQAQECILEKSILDTRKPSVIGAVAIQVMYFYKNSLALLGPSSGSDNIHDIIATKLYNYWHRYLSFKMAYVGCIACLYQGMNAEEQQKMGERVAYYQQAADKLAESRKLAKYIEPTQVTAEALTFTNDVVEGKKKAAKNENEFIYHEEVPDKDLLLDLKPVCLVKALPINLNDPELAGQDVFSRLVPMGAHEASSMYSEEKAKLLRHVVGQAEVKNAELTEFMSSLQLEQLEVLDSDQKIPQEVVDRCAAMNAKSEIIQTLVDSMNNLAEIINDVEHSLAEIKGLIQEETLKEKDYQKTMGPRPPSIVQTELSREFHKYQEAHTRTNESNQVLHKAMTLHIANLRLLSQPLDVLQAKIPSIDNIEDLDRETMSEMRRVVDKAREMQIQRDSLVQELREAVTSDDITAQLLARSSEPTEDIFKQELEKHTPKVKIIEQNLAAQENIINKLTALYASYGESRRLLADVLRKREGLINALITSYDTYEELLGKSQKGLEFYKKLSHNVNQLLSRLRSTCQVQEEERAQLMSKHTTKAPAPAPVRPAPNTSTAPEFNDLPTPGGISLKLKDYLPYIKTRGLARSLTSQARVDATPTDGYYPESIYPTSIRPTPVGSEATDLTQMKVPDGVVMPAVQNPYNQYNTPYAPSETDAYSVQSNYTYPATSKAYDKPDDAYGYSSYTPSQFSNQMTNQQSYSNPYYSAMHSNNATSVTDSQNSMPYGANAQANTALNTAQFVDPKMGQIPEVPMSAYNTMNQADLTANFANMQVSVPKSEPANFNAEYSHYYNPQYQQVSSANAGIYSSAGQNSNASISSQPTNYATTYPYNDPNQYPQGANVPSSSDYNQGMNVNASHSPASYNQGTVTNSYGQPMNTNFSNPAYGQVNANVQDYGQGMDPNNASNITYGQGHNSSVNQYGQMINTNQPNNMQYANQYSQGINQNLASSNDYNQQNLNNSNASVYGQSVTTEVSAANQFAQVTNSNANAYNADQYSTAGYNMSQGYTIYTNADNIVTSTTSVVNTTAAVGQPYAIPSGENYINPALSQIDTIDKPIKSHVRGEALSTAPIQQTYQNYDMNTGNYNVAEQNYPPNSSYQYGDQTNVNYAQTYQNHPGYAFNNSTGAYDYNYGSQNSYTNCGNTEQGNLVPQSASKDPNWSAQGVYTSAGICQTVQSPSEAPIPPPGEQSNNNQMYYNTPYGYQTAMQSNETPPNPQNLEPVPTNYGAEANHSTYMQSEHEQNTSVTFTSSQVSTPKENVSEPNVEANPTPVQTNAPLEPKKETEEAMPPENRMVETKSALSAFDLLSDIDFSVEHKPLMPEIKVPQISESVIKKPTVMNRPEPVAKPAPKEEVIERPAKRDLFTDPSLLNSFTQEVKKLQKFVDSLTCKSAGGLTLLDSKWKSFQEVQANENMNRAKTIAMQHSEGNIVTEVVPFDDSRLTIKSDPDAYINASYYKQLASWCIPLVISKNPTENEYSIFWKAVLENKITCVVCLLSEIEMQGKCYWPTAMGQSLNLNGGLKVTLNEVTCTVHWTERKLTVACGKTVLNVTHYQINVFPAKIVCSPLVLLADKILSQTYDNRVSNQLCGAWIQCNAGAGRSAVVSLLIMVMCQVRAGQLDLNDMLDSGFTNLHKHRCNVLEDTKYVADAYRTVLFYVQGVLCSGTTMFNGEAVSAPSGASVLPPPTPSTSATSITSQKQKFSRESFEEMKQSPGLKSGDMKDPLNFLDPLWSLKRK